jgi:diguanylate cyclase (GGDEF)-like protein
MNEYFDQRKSDTIIDILKLCLSIDKKAASIYQSFWRTCEDEELKDFWKQKSKEETRHVGLWRKLIKLAKNGAVPNIFEEPLRIVEELKSIVSKIDKLFQSVDCHDINKSFLLALRMEFYALHPAFAMLFRFINDMQLEKLPEEHYDEHLRDFFEIIKRHHALTPELEFISETIWHLWRDNERLALESHIDGLTKIFNRKGFYYAIKPLSYVAQRNHLAVAIVMIDIDNFKQLNDTYGHQAGDKALAQVANLIKANIRKSDILCRYGGEEFCIFIVYSEKASLMKVAEKIRKEIEDGTKTFIPVTVSIGIASDFIETEVEREIDQLIKHSDECLYQAKSLGKNMVTLKEDALEIDGQDQQPSAPL